MDSTLETIKKTVLKKLGSLKEQAAFLKEFEGFFSSLKEGVVVHSEKEDLKDKLHFEIYDLFNHNLYANIDLTVNEKTVMVQGFWASKDSDKCKNARVTYRLGENNSLNIIEMVTERKKDMLDESTVVIGNKKMFDASGIVVLNDTIKSVSFETGVFQKDGLKVYSNYMQDIHQTFENSEHTPTLPMEERLTLVRTSIDMAHEVYYKANGDEEPLIYTSEVLLDKEKGLENMIPTEEAKTFPEEVIISELSKEEIDNLISEAKDPKIQEGLRMWAQGRDKMHYYSKEDSNFKREGFNEQKSLS